MDRFPGKLVASDKTVSEIRWIRVGIEKLVQKQGLVTNYLLVQIRCQSLRLKMSPQVIPWRLTLVAVLTAIGIDSTVTGVPHIILGYFATT
jgi:hypothetical protein